MYALRGNLFAVQIKVIKKLKTSESGYLFYFVYLFFS